jgi:hypothetical protein
MLQPDLFGSPHGHDLGGQLRLAVPASIRSRAVYGGERDCCRYILERRWRGEFGDPGYDLCLLMNPSTATEHADDPTVAGCIERSVQAGFGALIVLNAFAYRSTDKQGLLRVADPVGPDNDAWIGEIARHAGRVIVGWGQPPKPLRGRGAEVARILAEAGASPVCLGVNADGSPRHPLYISRSAKPVPWLPRAA